MPPDTFKLNKLLLYLLAVILASRLLPMLLVPFFDPTEARYAEIARIMMETGDWITPFFDYGVPFWGKPPLSFWAQAMSFHLFGINDFAPRFPSWIATILIIGLIFYLLRHMASLRVALLANVIFASCLLSFALSGAVITDPYLTLSVTLALVAFLMAYKQKQAYWGYLFFTGLAIGMLAKGPIAVVLIVGPLVIWLLVDGRRWHSLKRLPWIGGILLSMALTLPWYIAAEVKTPGFIEYFIVGEHFYRFVDPGWSGDLYGSAHKHAKGYIWLLWLVASFPWGLIALTAIGRRMTSRESRAQMLRLLRHDDISYYFIWALFTVCFFTIAGNVLWTYVLPALPALAILLALYIDKSLARGFPQSIGALSVAGLIAPLALVIATFYLSQHHQVLPTEKYLVEYYNNAATSGDQLAYVGERPFSARYYSRGKAKLVSWALLQEFLDGQQDKTVFLAVPFKQLEQVRAVISPGTTPLYKSREFALLKIPPAPGRNNVLR